MTDVIPFKRLILGNIPEALRMLAHQIEANPALAVRAVLVTEPEGAEAQEFGVNYQALGAEPFTRAHAAGVLEAAKLRVLLPVTQGDR